MQRRKLAGRIGLERCEFLFENLPARSVFTVTGASTAPYMNRHRRRVLARFRFFRAGARLLRLRHFCPSSRTALAGWTALYALRYLTWAKVVSKFLLTYTEGIPMAREMRSCTEDEIRERLGKELPHCYHEDGWIRRKWGRFESSVGEQLKQCDSWAVVPVATQPQRI